MTLHQVNGPPGFLADLARTVFRQAAAAHGVPVEDYAQIAAEGKGSVYVIPGHGFCLVGKEDATLQVFAVEGPGLFSRTAFRLLRALAEAEGCTDVAQFHANPRLGALDQRLAGPARKE